MKNYLLEKCPSEAPSFRWFLVMEMVGALIEQGKGNLCFCGIWGQQSSSQERTKRFEQLYKFIRNHIDMTKVHTCIDMLPSASQHRVALEGHRMFTTDEKLTTFVEEISSFA